MPPEGDVRFVGRKRQLAALEAALADARAGRGRCIAVVGEAGIGKTRTVEEFVRQSEVASDRVVFARCAETEGAPPYWPWMAAVRRYADGRDDDALRADLGTDAAVIAQMVPSLRARLPEVEVPRDDGQVSRFVLFEGVAAFLRRATARDALVLVFDDLHWADESTLLLLGFLARELTRMRVLLVCTYRAREARRLPHGLAELARVAHSLALHGLDRTEVEDFVARRLGTSPSAALVERLHQRSEGNPLFLDGLTRVVEEHSADSAQVDADRTLTLPDDVRAAIRRRLDPLSEHQRDLLAIAAVVGREFDMPLVQTASDAQADAVLACVTAAVATGVVVEDEVLGRFRFSHALVRETLYGDLLPATRAALHRKVGHALEAVGGGDLETSLAELAVHFFYATPLGEGARALDYCTKAGASAVARLAYDEAVAHYERALRVASLHPCAEERRIDLMLTLADAARRAGDTGKARDAYQRAARGARVLGDTERLVRAALGAYRATGRYGVHAPVVALLEEALLAIGDSDGALTVAILAALAVELHFSRDDTRGLELSERAVAMARRLGDPRSLLPALIARHVSLLPAEDISERLAITREMTALGATAAGIRHTGSARVCRIIDALETGDVATATQEIDRHAQQAESSRLAHLRWHARVLRCHLALLAGRHDDADRLATDALAVSRDGQDPAVMAVFFLERFYRRFELGRLAELETTSRGFTRDEPGVIPWITIQIILELELGESHAARAQLDALAAHDFDDVPRDAHYPAVLCALAEIVAALDDRDRATLLYPRLAPYDGRNVVVHTYTAASRGAAARYLGLLAATMGTFEAAERHFADALAMNERMGARPQVAHTQHDLARLLLARGRDGDAERASALLADAWRTAEELGMTRLLDRIAALRSSMTAALGVSDSDKATASAASAVLRLEGQMWVVAYGGESARLKTTKGLHYLRTLLDNPGHEFHVLDLAADADVDGAATADAGPRARNLGDAGDHLDAAARSAYKQRLADLRDDLEEARRFNDPERAARAEREIALLADELARAVGLGGRNRKAAAAAERARVNLSRTIGAVLKRIAEVNPALGQILSASVRTGTFCSYNPDPRLPIRWDLEQRS